MGARPRVEPVDARVAHPALGNVDDALERHLVGGVHDRAQIGDDVLHLASVVETRAPDHLVGKAEAHERLLQHAAHGVGAVEDGDVAPPVVVLVVET